MKSVRAAAMIMIGTWAARLVEYREPLTTMQPAAKTTPIPIRMASWRRTPAGGLACHMRQATATMMAATASPVTAGWFQAVAGREEASAAPNKGSAKESRRPFGCLVNGVNDSVRDPNLRSGPNLEAYLLVFAWGLWGTVRFSGGRRPAWSGLTF